MEQEPLPKASNLLFAGLYALRTRTKRTKNEAKTRRDSNTNSTRRGSVISRPSHEVDDPQALSIPTIHRPQGDKALRWDAASEINTGDETDDAETSASGKFSLHVWNQFTSTTKAETSQATVMYSISFYPWKMEPHCYYSHPEAAANWVPDTASTRCQICLATFTLTRRRHHCRLCGHLVCATCSHGRTYLPFAGSAPSQHRLIKDGVPQRTCTTCANTLRNMAGQDDPRVKRFTVAVSSARRRKPIVSAMSISSSHRVVEVEIERPSPWLRRTGLAFTDSDMEDEEFGTGATKAAQFDQPARESTHQQQHSSLRLSVNPAEELDEILRARTCPQVYSRNRPHSRQFVISSAWLNQWLRYVQVGSTSADATGSTSAASMRLSYQSYRNGMQSHKSTAKCRIAKTPRPGPVANYSLLDFVNGELLPKPHLQRSRGSHVGGDYRLVSQEVWTAFLNLYSGGPSIQVPCTNGDTKTVLVNDQPRPPTQSQWIITESNDSLPALAASPPVERYSSTTRAAPRRGSEAKCKASHATSTDSMPRKRLISAASMPLLVKKTAERCAETCDSPRLSFNSRWKLWEEDVDDSSNSTGETSST